MARTQQTTTFATEADFFAIPEVDRFHELLAGEIDHKALPSGRHGSAQGSVFGALMGYRRPESLDGPGGWRFATEAEVRLSTDTIVRPDVAGWRREHLPAFPETSPIAVRPDWVCEVLSRSNIERDLLVKMSLYHRAEIPHYWVLDPDRRRLRVHRWTSPGYLIVVDVGPDEVVRAEPFELIEITVAALFDDEG